MLHGFDVSNWDSGMRFRGSGIDFLIFKATEGTYFVDKDAPDFYDQCIRYKFGCGFYHFAGHGDARAEADFFFAHTSGWHGVPVLDYETENGDNAAWCERFMERYHEITGVWPMLYISAYRCKQYSNSWIPSKCKLWVAGYPMPYTTWIPDQSVPYDVRPWSVGDCAIWQFTSSYKYEGHNLDANLCYAPSIFGGSTMPVNDVERIAMEVINGKWGNGEERRNRLTQAGYNYDLVQRKVNQILAPKSIDTLAYEVIDGKWGNGAVRKKALTNAGYDYDTVQRRVNQILLG